jgi:hypothetical protein
LRPELVPAVEQQDETAGTREQRKTVAADFVIGVGRDSIEDRLAA